MSKTKKDMIRGKYKRSNNKYHRELDKLIAKLRRDNPGCTFVAIYSLSRHSMKNPWNALTEYEKKVIINYSKNPSWFNHLFNRKPKRRHDRDILKTEHYENDRYLFSLNNKPKAYYW